MSDNKVTIQELKEKALAFVQARDWQQFHSPKNLSMALAIEAAELMEKFRFVESSDSMASLEEQRVAVEDELADVVWAALSFANATNIDISKAFERKLASTAERYPVDKVKGKSEYAPAKNKK